MKSWISPEMKVSNTPSHSLPFGSSLFTKIDLGSWDILPVGERDGPANDLAISLTIRFTPGIAKLVPATNNRSTLPSFSPFRPIPLKSRSTTDPIFSPCGCSSP